MVRRVGTDGNDRIIFSSSSDDEVLGLKGNDTLQSSFGNDLLDGGEGNDLLNGKAANDTLKGGSGNDRLIGDAGDDILEGGDGDDFLSGGANNDLLDGGSGDDRISVTGGTNTLIGGIGNDSLGGGFGNDTFIGVDPNTGAGSGEQDTLTQGRGRLRNESNLFVLGDENNAFYLGAGDNDLALVRGFDPAQDKLQLNGSVERYSLNAAPGHDPRNGNARLFLDFDDDTIALFEGENFNLFDLSEQIFVGDASPPPDDNDDPPPVEEPPVIIIGPGTLFGTDGNDALSGGNEDNLILGLLGNDTLNGGGGNDTILGGNGRDLLAGDGGDDLLFGGDGRDRYRGGQGDDTFTLAPQSGRDVILDFQDGSDLIGLADGLAFADLDIVQLSNNRTAISTDGIQLGILQRVNADLINADDFVSVQLQPSLLGDGIEIPVVDSNVDIS